MNLGRIGLQHGNCLSGVGSFKYFKPVFEKSLYYCHSDKQFIFDHDYDDVVLYFPGHEALSTSLADRSAFSLRHCKKEVGNRSYATSRLCRIELIPLY